MDRAYFFSRKFVVVFLSGQTQRSGAKTSEEQNNSAAHKAPFQLKSVELREWELKGT